MFASAVYHPCLGPDSLPTRTHCFKHNIFVAFCLVKSLQIPMFGWFALGAGSSKSEAQGFTIHFKPLVEKKHCKISVAYEFAKIAGQCSSFMLQKHCEYHRGFF